MNDPTDPGEVLALEAATRLSDLVITSLNDTQRNAPLLLLIADLREQAADAILNLIDADPEDTVKVRQFQNDVRIFTKTMDRIRILIEEGKEAERRLAVADQEEAQRFAGLSPDAAVAQGQGRFDGDE